MRISVKREWLQDSRPIPEAEDPTHQFRRAPGRPSPFRSRRRRGGSVGLGAIGGAGRTGRPSDGRGRERVSAPRGSGRARPQEACRARPPQVRGRSPKDLGRVEPGPLALEPPPRSAASFRTSVFDVAVDALQSHQPWKSSCGRAEHLVRCLEGPDHEAADAQRRERRCVRQRWWGLGRMRVRRQLAVAAALPASSRFGASMAPEGD